MTLTVTTDNKGLLPKLLVGHLSPVSSGVYVKLADKPAVLMTTSDFLTAVSKKVNDVRSHELVTFNMDDAQQIVLRSGVNQPIEIDRQGGQWRIVAPEHYAADADTVAQILTALVDAHVNDFVTDAPADLGQYGLKNPQIEVSVLPVRTRPSIRCCLDWSSRRPPRRRSTSNAPTSPPSTPWTTRWSARSIWACSICATKP